MPKLTDEHINRLGPLIDPFYRSETKTFDFIELDIKGEARNDIFMYAMHDGLNNGKPDTKFSKCLELTIEEREDKRILEGKKFFEKCYLWVIDEISIKIMLEKTPNITRGASIVQKSYVCHTNITGCSKALVGGEMYFCEDGNIYMNFSSDRYGYHGNDQRKQLVIEIMKHMKYENIFLIDDNNY